MAKITPKENFLKIAYGGMPEYVPFFTMMGIPYMDECADTMLVPDVFGETHFMDGGFDMWGVPHKADSTSGIAMPDTSKLILEDICDWRDVIKCPDAPKASEIDWEDVYRKSLERSGVDRERTAVKVGPSIMPFQELVALMGFSEGLVAMYTDPDEVSAMLNYMVDFLEPYFTTYIDYFKPDLWYMLDDTCAKNAPFISVETYRQILKPIYQRLAKPANDRGIPIIFHNCGKIEAFMDEMVDFGVAIVEPTQETNDMLMLKEKYKGRVGFVGGWDWGVKRPHTYPEFDEEEVRQGVRDTIDKYAPGGGYSFAAWPISYAGDPALPVITEVIRNEAHWYGRKVYGYKDE